MSEQTWTINGLELDRRSFSLRRDGKAVRLDPKPLELLFLLVESQGRIISHDEALRHVWGKNVFLNGEAALYTAVKKIRQAIGDATLIETVPGRGYRLRAVIDPHVKSPASLAPFQQEEQRLAILPLANLSHDQEQEYFSAGLTEELINTLSRLLRGQMGVIARTSIMRYRFVSKPVQEIARELNADYLVEGSVRRHGSKVRIAVQLLRAADGTAIWSESFERLLGDVFALQDEIALATATAIGLHISPPMLAGEDRKKPATVDSDVHDRYLRARYLLSQRTGPSIQAAMRYFGEALALDQGFAPALASLAFCHALLPITSRLRPHDCFPEARRLARETLLLDPAQADAHIALGLVDFWYERDWSAARSHFTEAAKLTPGDSAPPMFMAHVQSVLGEHDQALTTLAAALRLDPVSPIVRTHHGHFLYNAGRSREAIAPLKQVLELNPQFWVAHLMRGKALATLDYSSGANDHVSSTHAEAIEAFALSERFGMGNTEPLAFRIHALATFGQQTAASEALAQMQQMHVSAPVPALHRALALLGTGAREAALELLEEGFAERDVRLIFLSVESRWQALGGHHYGQALMRAGLPNPPSTMAERNVD